MELSDDSDVEGRRYALHAPSVNRAGRSKIHVQREQRQQQMTALQYQYTINETLKQRLSEIVSSLKTADSSISRDRREAALEITEMLALAAGADGDQPPPPPYPVPQTTPMATYSQMMTTILEDVNQKLVTRDLSGVARDSAFLDGLEVHLQNIAHVQSEITLKLDTMQKEFAKKITSENYHTGFNSSQVNKTVSVVEAQPPAAPELLNPNYKGKQSGDTQLPPLKQVDGTTTISPVAIAFGDKPSSDYSGLQAFMYSHPEILEESKVDELLIAAFHAGVQDEHSPKVQQYVHQAVVLQCCHMLGQYGSDIFFKRMATAGHEARDLFRVEFTAKLSNIRARVREQRLASKCPKYMEKRVFHPEPSIQIRIPEVGSDERILFDGFPPDLQEALQNRSLEQLNQVLGALDVAEAETLVDLLSEVRLGSCRTSNLLIIFDRLSA